MLEVLEFVFSDGWHFAGSVVLIIAIGLCLPANIIKIEHRYLDED